MLGQGSHCGRAMGRRQHHTAELAGQTGVVTAVDGQVTDWEPPTCMSALSGIVEGSRDSRGVVAVTE